MIAHDPQAFFDAVEARREAALGPIDANRHYVPDWGETRKRKKPQAKRFSRLSLPVAEMYAYYMTGVQVEMVARRYDTSHMTVRRVFRENGLEMRPSGRRGAAMAARLRAASEALPRKEE